MNDFNNDQNLSKRSSPIDSSKKEEVFTIPPGMWPSFRGPYGHGVAHDQDAPLITKLDELKIKWKTPIEISGFNSPIIYDNKIFISGATAEKEIIFAYHSESGKILWQEEIGSVPGAPTTALDVSFDTGYAAPTMALDKKAVYAIFASGNLVSYDFMGKARWKKNIGIPNNKYGHSSSLLIYQNKVLVQYDREDEAAIMAFDSSQGEELWNTSREVLNSWASPIIISHDKNASIRRLQNERCQLD